MRVVFFSQLYSPAVYGGGEVVFKQYAEGLAKLGCDVHVVTQKLKGEKSFQVLKGVKVHRVGLPVEYKGSLSLGVFSNLSYLIQGVIAGFCIGCDIVHSNTYTGSLIAQTVSVIKRVPHIMTVHDVYFNNNRFWKDWSSQEGVSFLGKIIGPFLEKIVLNLKVDKVHTVSETSKRDILKVTKKNKVIVIPNSLDFKNHVLKKKIKRDYSQFVYLGRHVFYKNVDRVIKALTKVPDARLVVIGDGPMRVEWESLSKKLGAGNRVEFTGRVNHNKKLELLASSAALVLPSDIEGFGVCLLEAMFLGTPCLVNNTPPLNELVAHDFNGLLVDNNSVTNWAKSMKKLVNNKNFFKKLSKNSLKFAKKYQLKDKVKELLNLYKSL